MPGFFQRFKGGGEGANSSGDERSPELWPGTNAALSSTARRIAIRRPENERRVGHLDRRPSLTHVAQHSLSNLLSSARAPTGIPRQSSLAALPSRAILAVPAASTLARTAAAPLVERSNLSPILSSPDGVVVYHGRPRSPAQTSPASSYEHLLPSATENPIRRPVSALERHHRRHESSSKKEEVLRAESQAVGKPGRRGSHDDLNPLVSQLLATRRRSSMRFDEDEKDVKRDRSKAGEVERVLLPVQDSSRRGSRQSIAEPVESTATSQRSSRASSTARREEQVGLGLDLVAKSIPPVPSVPALLQDANDARRSLTATNLARHRHSIAGPLPELPITSSLTHSDSTSPFPDPVTRVGLVRSLSEGPRPASTKPTSKPGIATPSRSRNPFAKSAPKVIPALPTISKYVLRPTCTFGTQTSQMAASIPSPSRTKTPTRQKSLSVTPAFWRPQPIVEVRTPEELHPIAKFSTFSAYNFPAGSPEQAYGSMYSVGMLEDIAPNASHPTGRSRVEDSPSVYSSPGSDCEPRRPTLHEIIRHQDVVGYGGYPGECSPASLQDSHAACSSTNNNNSLAPTPGADAEDVTSSFRCQDTSAVLARFTLSNARQRRASAPLQSTYSPVSDAEDDYRPAWAALESTPPLAIPRRQSLVIGSTTKDRADKGRSYFLSRASGPASKESLRTSFNK